jgi:outer membrane protein insertion porin family
VSTSGATSLFSSGQRSPLPAGSLANLLHSGITSSWKAALTHDTRDNRLRPRSGWYDTASIELAEPAFLSQNQYTRVEATSHRWVPLWGPLTLHLKLDGGLVTSRSPQGVPIYERYFLGGAYDVRGFPLASLSPQVRVPRDQSPASALGTFAVGGNLQVDGKAELEFPIVEKVGIRGVLFTDFGNSYNLEDQYCRLRPALVDASHDPCNKLFPLTSLRSSWGLGVRWLSPIGPLRFEWGFPYHPLPGEQTYVFEFTIDNGL